MARQRIAIVGGGAKCAALCAKAACLREIGNLDVEAVVFERNKIGATWDGEHGYTDGRQRLCTPAERDVGYPYTRTSFGAEIASAMQARFSWAAFAVEAGFYGDWVDRGRPLPRHRRFAEYLDYCIGKSGALLVLGEVTNLDPSGGKWAVTYLERPGGTRRSSGGFDGVVITSTGPCARRFPKEPDPRVFDAVTFWQDLAMVAAAASASDDPVVIVGSGGTAAAAAGWLASANIKNPIAMIGSQPALYARTDSFFENALFRDGETWDQLSTEDRTQFTERLTRGAVWANVVDALAQSGRISYVPGRVSAVRHDPAGDPTGELVVEYAMSGDPSRRRLYPASVVVDAIGFDDSWFAELLPDALKRQVLKEPARMRSDMSRSLELPLTGGEHLHAPMLSQAMGPAYASLMALGLLSDAVLKPYVEAALT